VELGQALKENKHHSIVSIDFSKSSLDDKAAQSLSEAFSAFPHGLLYLDLSECGLNDRSLTG
jgi:hypothetical protein